MDEDTELPTDGGSPKASHYAGATRNGRCNGHGRYTVKDGTYYEGNFQDDLFDGDGEVRFADGVVFKGKWANGELKEGQLIFPDGLVYDAGLPGSNLANADKPWKYCDGIDRRFWSEIQNDLTGKQSVTANPNPPQIPETALDVGNGYYDLEKRKVFNYDGSFMRNVDKSEHFWMMTTCRKGWVEEIGRTPTTHF